MKFQIGQTVTVKVGSATHNGVVVQDKRNLALEGFKLDPSKVVVAVKLGDGKKGQRRLIFDASNVKPSVPLTVQR
jgi:hypothetical protein